MSQVLSGAKWWLAQETASQIALRNCSKEVGKKVSIYVILGKGEYMQFSMFFFFFFCRRFLLVMRDTHHHWRILVLFWIWRDIGILYFYYFILFFIFLDSKITAEGDCSHEIKRRLLLGRKVMTNLDSILKSRDTTLSTKVCLVKATFFPVVMYGCESWTTKKAEAEELMLLNCLVGEDSWESLGLQGDPTSPS